MNLKNYKALVIGTISSLIANVVLDVLFETDGIALAALNTAVGNVSSYVHTSIFAITVSTLSPIANIIFLIVGIWTLLGVFGADKYITFG